MAAALKKSILAGKLYADLQTATAFVEKALQEAGDLPPLGLAAPKLTPDEDSETIELGEPPELHCTHRADHRADFC